MPSMPHPIRLALTTLVAGSALILVACGGSTPGSGSSVTTSPAVSPAGISPQGGAAAAPGVAAIPADWRSVTIRQRLALRMPPDWTTQVNPDGIVVLDPPDQPLPPDVMPGSGAVVVEIIPGTFAQFLAATNPSTGSLNRDLYRQYASSVIDGRPATVTYGGCCGGMGQYVFVESGPNLYKFGLFGPEAQPGQTMTNEAVFRQILSSVRLPS